MSDIVSADVQPVPTELDLVTGWQASLRNAIRCPLTLLRRLGLEQELGPNVVQGHPFPTFVTEEFAARIRPADASDPLLRQVLTVKSEGESQPGFVSDPLNESRVQPIPGLVHKYRNRALLILTGSCAVNCRYCFRREFPYSQSRVGADRWDEALAKIANSPEIEEVIYSGGDPLTIVDDSLSKLTTLIASIRHVRTLRVHTRLPIVIPSRIESTTIDWLRLLPTTVVVHINHAQEIDDCVTRSIARLRHAGINVLNQAVLLRGVNDTLDALCNLSWRLIEIGIIPYYLHQLDRVRGASHFEVSVARGMALVKQMRDRLPGYAVPRYALEEPGQSAKTILV